MNIIEICEEIKTLIKDIFIAHQEAEKNIDTSSLKVGEAVTALREMIKKKGIAPLQIKYSGRNTVLTSYKRIVCYKNKQIVWSKEHGLGRQSQSNNPSSTIEPLVVKDGDYKVQDLAFHIHNQLQSTLNTIQNQNKDCKNYIDELEQFINCLKQLD